MNKFKRNNFLSGFTLIELLVVIGIITIFATIVIASVNKARTKSKNTKAQAEVKELARIFAHAQGEANSRLQDITGSGCTGCTCKNQIPAQDIRDISSSDSCYIDWISALNNIEQATGMDYKIKRFSRDPWNSPYVLDENERENGPDDCTPDTIQSAGADGRVNSGDDDIYYEMSPSRPCP